MTIFAIETSTPVCSVAWCIDGQCVAQRIHYENSNHAALLPVFIRELLNEAQQNGWKADSVAVSAGPGSYTGLRIGVSFAKGLCYGWNVPLIAVPTLDILCQSFLSSPLSPDTCHLSPIASLVPMLDARRMEVYTEVDGQVLAKVVDNANWLPKDGEVYYFGDGAKKCQPILESEHCHFIDQIIPQASVMGVTIAQHHYPLIEEKELAYYTPFYLKEFIAAPSHIKGLK